MWGECDRTLRNPLCLARETIRLVTVIFVNCKEYYGYDVDRDRVGGTDKPYINRFDCL